MSQRVEGQIDFIITAFSSLCESALERQRLEYNFQVALRKLVEYAKEEGEMGLSSISKIRHHLAERKKRMENEKRPTRADQPLDIVEKPAHYNRSKYEHQAVAKNWEMSAWAYCATKYLMRCPHKENMLVDLKKGRWYLRGMVDNPDLAIASYGYWKRDGAGPKFPRLFQVDDVAKEWANGDELFQAIFVCIGDAILYSASEFDMLKLLRQALMLAEQRIGQLENPSEEDAKR